MAFIVDEKSPHAPSYLPCNVYCYCPRCGGGSPSGHCRCICEFKRCACCAALKKQGGKGRA